MIFNNLNKSYSEAGIAKEEINEKAKIIEDLVAFSVKYDNPFYFEDEDFGLDENSELIKDRKIKREVLEGLNKDDKEIVERGVENFLSFIQGPIFTDSFHEDASSRENWKDTYLKKLSGKALEYYNSNRLRVNVNTDTVYFLNEIEESILGSDIKNKLNILNKRIPREFKNRYENEDGVNVLIYFRLSDKEKVRVVEELTEIIKEAIPLLTEKRI